MEELETEDEGESVSTKTLEAYGLESGRRKTLRMVGLNVCKLYVELKLFDEISHILYKYVRVILDEISHTQIEREREILIELILVEG